MKNILFSILFISCTSLLAQSTNQNKDASKIKPPKQDKGGGCSFYFHDDSLHAVFIDSTQNNILLNWDNSHTIDGSCIGARIFELLERQVVNTNNYDTLTYRYFDRLNLTQSYLDTTVTSGVSYHYRLTRNDRASGRTKISFSDTILVVIVDSITACDSYTWIDSITYTSSNNTAIDTLVNSAGYDSIVSLYLTINNSTSSTDVQTACNSFSWIDGITYTSNNNSARDTIQNSVGCDSIVTLDLTIINADIVVFYNQDTLVSNASGAGYQWLDCNNNLAAIPNATSQKYLPAQSGSYAVEVTENGCTDTSSCTTFSVGIKDIDIEKLIAVFPNPTNDRISIQTSELKIAQIELIDTKGSVIMEINKNVSTIDVSQLNNGIYYLRIVTYEKGIVFKRIVKM